MQYEMDIATAIADVFDGELELEEDFPLSPWPITAEAFQQPRLSSKVKKMNAQEWKDRAATRKDTLDELCWNEGAGMYFDYDTKAKKQARYESVTTLWPLWAGCASEEQAIRIQ